MVTYAKGIVTASDCLLLFTPLLRKTLEEPKPIVALKVFETITRSTVRNKRIEIA